MKLLLGRISFSKTKQQKLFPDDSEKKPIDILASLLLKKDEYIPQKKHYHYPLIFGNFIKNDEGKLLGGYIGRGTHAKIPDHNNELGFYDKDDTIYPRVYFFWDRINQIILIEKRSKPFKNYQSVFNSIEEHFNDLMYNYDYTLKIEPISDVNDFWKIIVDSKFIYEVQFELHKPNLFGDISREFSEMLNEISNEYNSTSVTQKILNPKGKLKISKENIFIAKALDWIGRGGGNWRATIKKLPGDEKEEISSKQESILKTISIDRYSENFSAEEVNEIILEAKNSKYYSVGNEDD